MHCAYHDDRFAEQICAGCGKPLCSYCSQAVILGEYYCFQCAMLLSSLSNGAAADHDQIPAGSPQFEEIRRRGPLRHFCLVALVMIIVMIGVII